MRYPARVKDMNLARAGTLATLLACGGRTSPPVLVTTWPLPHAVQSELAETEVEKLPEVRAMIAAAAKQGIHMRFWRAAAGTPSLTGWLAATATGGDFAVELPVRFNDFSQSSKATDGVTIDLRSVGGVWSGSKIAVTHDDASTGPQVPSSSPR